MSETKRTLLERIDRNTGSTQSDLISLLIDLREMLRTHEEVGQKLLTLAHQTKAGIKMANQAITELTSQFNDATNATAARIDRLIAGLGDTVSPEQLTELTAIKDRLVALGQDPNNPVPTV